jgi:hypothetical protein
MFAITSSPSTTSLPVVQSGSMSDTSRSEVETAD